MKWPKPPGPWWNQWTEIGWFPPKSRYYGQYIIWARGWSKGSEHPIPRLQPDKPKRDCQSFHPNHQRYWCLHKCLIKGGKQYQKYDGRGDVHHTRHTRVPNLYLQLTDRPGIPNKLLGEDQLIREEAEHTWRRDAEVVFFNLWGIYQSSPHQGEGYSKPPHHIHICQSHPRISKYQYFHV